MDGQPTQCGVRWASRQSAARHTPPILPSRQPRDASRHHHHHATGDEREQQYRRVRGLRQTRSCEKRRFAGSQAKPCDRATATPRPPPSHPSTSHDAMSTCQHTGGAATTQHRWLGSWTRKSVAAQQVATREQDRPAPPPTALPTESSTHLRAGEAKRTSWTAQEARKSIRALCSVPRVTDVHRNSPVAFSASATPPTWRDCDFPCFLAGSPSLRLPRSLLRCIGLVCMHGCGACVEIRARSRVFSFCHNRAVCVVVCARATSHALLPTCNVVPSARARLPAQAVNRCPSLSRRPAPQQHATCRARTLQPVVRVRR